VPVVRRTLLIGTATAAGHLVLAGLLPALAAFFVLCAVATLGASGAMARLLETAERERPDDDGPSGGGGPPDAPGPDGPPDGEPVWWPEFEDAFRRHASGLTDVRTPT
jgi:hypothetical protein